MVEGGATKSVWCILDAQGGEVGRLMMPGMNVSTMPMDRIQAILVDALSQTGHKEVEGLYLYLAGVVTPAIREELTSCCTAKIAVGEMDVQNDLMGAARSVCGRNPGIVAILGTGSNTCFFDGKDVSQKVMSGGYVLGDDGSAASLGKLFLSDFIKNLIPQEVAWAFSQEFDASYAAIVENVYRSGTPSRYLGSLAPFILRHYGNPYVREMVNKNFQAFIDRSLLHYDTTRYPLGVVGGFGYACQDIFTSLAEQSGIRISGFVKDPIEGLIRYHSIIEK